MTIYSVIDIDTAIDYEPGEEVIGPAEAATPEEAIHEVLKAHVPGRWNVRELNPKGFDAVILPTLKAIPIG